MQAYKPLAVCHAKQRPRAATWNKCTKGSRPSTAISCQSVECRPSLPFIIITRPQSWYSFYRPTDGTRPSLPDVFTSGRIGNAPHYKFLKCSVRQKRRKKGIAIRKSVRQPAAYRPERWNNLCRNKQGVPIFLDATLAWPPANFHCKSCFSASYVPKPKSYTKFEVASFNGCRNKQEVPNFFGWSPIARTPVNFGPQSCFLVSYSPSPSCIPN